MKKNFTTKMLAIGASMLVALFILSSCASASNDMAEDIYDGEMEMSGSSIPSVDEKGEMADTVVKEEPSEYKPKIIKTATVYAETQDFRAATAEIESRVLALGGYVENSDVRSGKIYGNGASTSGYATYVLRIPADKLDLFLAEAGELLNVTSSSSTATDVSGQYYDMESRIKVLESERDILEEMLDNSKSVSEMIELENRLYDVIYEIESYKTALKVYDGKIAYSTVNLYLSEVVDLTTEDEITFGERFCDAVETTWNNFLEFCQDTAIFLVYATPTIVILTVMTVTVAAVVLITVKIILTVVKKKKNKK